jgi:divalent metal cation (Fe/Co/Zn/Cd) transporter
VSFFLLALYMAAEAAQDLVTGHRASAGVLGLVVMAVSLVLMPVLGYVKRRPARSVGFCGDGWRG